MNFKSACGIEENCDAFASIMDFLPLFYRNECLSCIFVTVIQTFSALVHITFSSTSNFYSKLTYQNFAHCIYHI